MRKVIYSAALSLDGFIARTDGSHDWIPEDPSIDWAAFMNRFDTVLMGRRTYEVIKKDSSGALFSSMKIFVFSRTLRPEDHPDVTLVAEDAAGEVARLRKAQGQQIWLMGGGALFRSLMDAGQVDQVETALVPAMIGGGIPFIQPGPVTHRLALEKSEATPAGLILATYRVIRGEG